MATHRLVPTTWHNVLGTVPPALTVADGDSVVTETIDAGGDDKHGVARWPGPNPMNGPIFVTGAEPGDALAVEIIRMTPIRENGWTRAVLAANVVDPERVRDLPPRDRADWIIDGAAGTVRLKEPVAGLEHLVLPLAPMIGCFGVAPSLGQAFSTATSAENGGNMDYRGFGPGTTAYFPVSVPGALFFLGDCHAIQGDGEIAGTGVETAMEVELRLSLRKGLKLGWPRGETEDTIFTVGNARPLDQALQHATTEMFDWLMADYGLSAVAASHLLGQVVRYEVGNVFDPAYTMVCKVEKRWLPRPVAR
ncbi:acetamidase/formamidase family protein [Devosia lacusdianchii]|uniref:acetamidase/formamidase family protein n=1 Tax=Devosia lacusdianchii TaxID=2917991 RepID=UPI001F05AA6C|nr:acetamidase/formamidase family protein [Devosia sp. JXJ CY 41]